MLIASLNKPFTNRSCYHPVNHIGNRVYYGSVRCSVLNSSGNPEDQANSKSQLTEQDQPDTSSGASPTVDNGLTSWSDESIAAVNNSEWDTGKPDVNWQHRQRNNNVLFALMLGGIAMFSFFLQRQHGLYRQRHPVDDAPAAATTTIARETYLEEEELAAQEDAIDHDDSVNALESAAKDLTIEDPVDTAEREEQTTAEEQPAILPSAAEEAPVQDSLEGEEHLEDEESLTQTDMLESHAEEQEDEAQQTLDGRFPIRTPEGAAALDKLRAVQDRRRRLYDNFERKQDERYEELEKEAAEREQRLQEEASAKFKRKKRGAHQATSEGSHMDDYSYGRQPMLRNYAAETFDGVYGTAYEQQQIQLPQGMSFKALRERALAANKAAAAAAAAANKAAGASAMAAQAADNASHAAQRASASASRCQDALDLHSSDAVEKAYNAAIEAEKVSEQAAQQAAVAAAKATQFEHDSVKQSKIATSAGDLSSPHTISDKVHAAWKNVSRGAKEVAEGTRNTSATLADNVKHLGQGLRHFGEVGAQRIGETWSALQSKFSK